MHPRERIKKKTRKLIPIHPRNKLKRQSLQIAAENAEILLKGKFNFSPQKILNKTTLFDTSRINEEKVMDKILEVFPANNDELSVLHEPATNAFTQNDYTRRWKVNKKSYMKQKLILKVSKLKRKVCYFLWKNSTLNYSEKLKKSTNVNDKKLLKLIHVAENSIE